MACTDSDWVTGIGLALPEPLKTAFGVFATYTNVHINKPSYLLYFKEKTFVQPVCQIIDKYTSLHIDI